jgi:Cytochrome c7 and related cytochrome c/Class III cytochrome C family
VLSTAVILLVARVFAEAPEQPIPFSHRAHVKAGLECKGCHPMPDTGEFATIPETAACMSCHDTVKTDSAGVRKLAEFHKAGKPVPWRRVYRIPDYVFFNHREHVEKGVTCQTCHGPVQERDALRKERDISMAACMECHRARQASVACNFCHNQR